jgi:hypothetical protein
MLPTSEPEGLPAPTGHHQVGRVSFDWVDPGRTEVYSSNPQDRRELVVFIWYPARPDPDAERAAYLPEPWAPAGQLLGLDAVGLLSHAVADAPAPKRSAPGWSPPRPGRHPTIPGRTFERLPRTDLWGAVSRPAAQIRVVGRGGP